MMAVTDIIGFSFFIILPGCLPALLSLVTVERFISSAFYLSHTHTPPRHATTPRSLFFLSFLFSSLFKRIPRPVLAALSRESPSFHLVLPSLTRTKFLLLVSIWYGCSLHFFGSFVIDRATGYLTILQQKEEWRFGGEQKGIY